MLNNIAGLLGGGIAPDLGAYEAISTVYGTGSSGVVTFSIIPSTYKHLQVRATAFASTAGQSIFPRLNGVSASGNYFWHYLEGIGSGTAIAGAAGSSGGILESLFQVNGTESSSTPHVFVMDLLDYTNTNKNKVARTLYGADANGSGTIGLGSGVFLTSGTAVSSISFSLQSGTFSSNSQFALYGIKG